MTLSLHTNVVLNRDDSLNWDREKVEGCTEHLILSGNSRKNGADEESSYEPAAAAWVCYPSPPSTAWISPCETPLGAWGCIYAGGENLRVQLNSTGSCALRSRLQRACVQAPLCHLWCWFVTTTSILQVPIFFFSKYSTEKARYRTSKPEGFTYASYRNKIS